MTDSPSQVKIGSLPQTLLAMARMKLQELKLIISEGRCPASELKDEKQRLLEESQKSKAAVLTVEGLIEFYLTERIKTVKVLMEKSFQERVKRKGKRRCGVNWKMMQLPN